MRRIFSTLTEAINGSPVINYNVIVTSTIRQIYTTDTAPVILNTGAAGYQLSGFHTTN